MEGAYLGPALGDLRPAVERSNWIITNSCNTRGPAQYSLRSTLECCALLFLMRDMLSMISLDFSNFFWDYAHILLFLE